MSQGSSSSTADIKRIGGVAVATGAGAVNAGTLRVQLSDESMSALENISVTIPGTVDLGTVSLTALETITVTDGGASLTVDAPVGTPVAMRISNGSAFVDTLPVTAAQSGAWNITNISGTITLPTGAATAANQATEITALQLLDDVVATDGAAALTKLYQVGGTDGTNAQILSLDTTGAVKLAAGANTIGSVSVTGSVAVTGTFWQATQPVSGPLTDVQLRATAVPVSLASVPSHAVTNAGTFAVQESGAALTALQLIDDTVSTAAAAASTKLLQVGGTDGTNARVLSLTTAGAVNIADAGGSLTVDGTVELGATTLAALETISVTALPAGTNNIGDVDVLSIIPGTGATNLGKAVNSVGGATDTGIAVLTLRDDALAAVSPADGDYARMRSDSTGRLWVSAKIDTALPAGANTIGAVNIAAAQTLATVTTVGAVTNLAQMGGQAIAMGTGVRTAGTQRVTIATDDVLSFSMSAAAKSNVTTSAYAASLIIKASAGTLFMLNGYNAHTSDQFIQIHDSATLPADATAPKLTFYAPAESNFYFDFGMYGRAFTAGIVVCNSTSGPTKTIGAANCWFDAQFS